MSIVALHFASGGAFFTGAACFLAGLVIVVWTRRKWLPPIGRLLILAGLFQIGSSANPLPIWAWCAWGLTFITWAALRFAKVVGTLRVPLWVSVLSLRHHARRHTGPTDRSVPARDIHLPTFKRLEAIVLLVLVGCTLAAVSWEILFQLPQRLPPGHWNRLVVIGDSLSAEDFTEGGDPWPTLLAREHKIRVVNLAFSGAKAGSAERHVSSEEVSGALVLLEIGGNDLFGATSPADFEQSVERLLQKVCRPDNAVVMLELPLPPLYNRFGEIQRRLARHYHVTLISKRYFAAVLAGTDATLDGLHLSRIGHQKLSAMIAPLILPSLVR